MKDSLFNQIKNFSPCYLLDMNELKRRTLYLKKNLGSRIELCYAMKANGFVIRDVDELVERFEVCSFGEFKICEKEGIDPLKLVISGVYKNRGEIREMLLYGCNLFTVESLEQFYLLLSFEKEIKVLLRLTSGNQFGMSQEDLEKIIARRTAYPYINIIGIEYFSGTQKTMKKITRELEFLDEYLEKLEKEYSFRVRELEYGGGFPVAYYEEQEFLEDDFLMEFRNLIEKMNYTGKIILELGRSMVASCGSYITQVKDIKENQNGRFAIVDGGIHQLVYYGSGLAMKKPILEVKPNRSLNKQEYNICGSLCTINDFLVKHLEADLEIGDYLIFKNTGAYSFMEGIALFLSRDLPTVFMLEGDRVVLARKKMDTYSLNSRKEVE